MDGKTRVYTNYIRKRHVVWAVLVGCTPQECRYWERAISIPTTDWLNMTRTIYLALRLEGAYALQIGMVEIILDS